ITSGVFLAALENMSSFGRGGEGFGVWLFNIARNDVNDFKKKRGRFQETAPADVTQEAAPADELHEAAPANEIVKEAPADGKTITRKVLLTHAGSLAAESKQRPQAAGLEGSRRAAGSERSRQTAGRFRSRRLLAPLAVAAALLLFTGTAWAASGASPDSSFYPLKERVEDVRTFLALQGLDRAASQTERAGKRLDEMLEIVERDRPGYVPGLLQSCDTHIDEARGLLDETGYRNSDTYAVEGMIKGMLERRRAVLLEISDRLPNHIRAEIADELLALEEGKDSGIAVTVAAAPAAPPPASDAAATATDSCNYATYGSGYAAVYGYAGRCYCIDYAGRVYEVASQPAAAVPGAAAMSADAAAPGAAAKPPPVNSGITTVPSPPPADTGNGGGEDDDDT
ncbi:MAG: DUF5667 domain-containing protein, partial [Actinomycetota bacterium]